MALVRVIGCGNPDAGDDAVGILAVGRARAALEALAGVEVVARAEPLAVVHLLEGVDAVLVVDAIRSPGSGRPVGALVRAESGPEGLPAELRSSLSTHGLGVVEAVGLAAAIGAAPRVVVLGVEAGETGVGRPLSEAVEQGLPRLTERIVAEATSLAGSLHEVERSPAEGSTGPGRSDGLERP